ncbi:MAG: hypothetical protein NDI77_12835 [Geobacteraceae bacterium]|nr:hypothetical protein [Geobacteraceae bacterium]
MNRIIRNAIVTLFLAAGTALAAEPAATSHEGMEHQQPAAETAPPKPADKDMPTTMPRRQGMHEGMGMGKNCDKGGGKEGMQGGMGGKMGGMGGMMGGCGGCGQEASSAVMTQDVLQALQDLAKVQEQLADGLKGAAKTRVQKDLADIRQRLDRLQADFRQSLKKEKGGMGGHKHGGH